MPRGSLKTRKTHNFKIADRGTHRDAVKTVDGRPMRLIAQQVNRRTVRSGKPSYIYHHEGGKNIYYNHGLHQAHYIPMGFNDAEMQKYYIVFVLQPQHPSNASWLQRNDYTMTKALPP